MSIIHTKKFFFIKSFYLGRCPDLPRYPDNKAASDTFSPPQTAHPTHAQLPTRTLTHHNTHAPAPHTPPHTAHAHTHRTRPHTPHTPQHIHFPKMLRSVGPSGLPRAALEKCYVNVAQMLASLASSLPSFAFPLIFLLEH